MAVALESKRFSNVAPAPPLTRGSVAAATAAVLFAVCATAFGLGGGAFGAIFAVFTVFVLIIFTMAATFGLFAPCEAFPSEDFGGGSSSCSSSPPSEARPPQSL